MRQATKKIAKQLYFLVIPLDFNARESRFPNLIMNSDSDFDPGLERVPKL